MLENLIKLIPFTPILIWIFDRSFRIARRRKYYSAQIATLEEYIKNTFNDNNLEFSLKDLKARKVTCNDWVGAKFLDFAIKNKCTNIFEAIHEMDKSWLLIKLEENNNKIELISPYKKEKLQYFLWTIIAAYIISGILFLSNKLFQFLLEAFNKSFIEISASFYDLIFFIIVSTLVISAILLITIGNQVACALALSKRLPVKFKL